MKATFGLKGLCKRETKFQFNNILRWERQSYILSSTRRLQRNLFDCSFILLRKFLMRLNKAERIIGDRIQFFCLSVSPELKARFLFRQTLFIHTCQIAYHFASFQVGFFDVRHLSRIARSPMISSRQRHSYSYRIFDHNDSSSNNSIRLAPQIKLYARPHSTRLFECRSRIAVFVSLNAE
jgi:hypothetical protein